LMARVSRETRPDDGQAQVPWQKFNIGEPRGRTWNNSTILSVCWTPPTAATARCALTSTRLMVSSRQRRRRRSPDGPSALRRPRRPPARSGRRSLSVDVSRQISSQINRSHSHTYTNTSQHSAAACVDCSRACARTHTSARFVAGGGGRRYEEPRNVIFLAFLLLLLLSIESVTSRLPTRATLPFSGKQSRVSRNIASQTQAQAAGQEPNPIGGLVR
jgi:hypothetical protein